MRLKIYGFAMADIGEDFGKVGDPDWYDVLRTTKLPSFNNEFGKSPRYFAGVRQSRLGVEGHLPTSYGEMWAKFEFELFGVGVDAGQTTIRLRHAYGEFSIFGAGQTWSPFMDPDVFPNSIEYWGPPGMPFYRNVQFRIMPIKTDTLKLTFAIERPGASSDSGIYEDRVELEDVKGRFPIPDVSAQIQFAGDWGHAQLSGIFRWIQWDDLGADAFDLADHVIGFGVTGSTVIKYGDKNLLKLQVVYGQGIENYMNDAPEDIGPEANPGNATKPIKGKALPLVGVVAFTDFYWNDEFSTSVGYSLVWIDNSHEQAASAFKLGHYALVNLLWTPIPEFFVGPEFQWGRRENFSDGWGVNDFRLQVSAKYTFAAEIAAPPPVVSAPGQEKATE